MEYPQYDYAVIGGDMRQTYLAEELAHHQNRVIHYALMAAPDKAHCSDAAVVYEASSLEEAIRSARCIICPIPLCKNKNQLNQTVVKEDLPLGNLFSQLKSRQFFFAGCIPQGFVLIAEDNGVFVFDLMKDDRLAFYNTIATAEGALCEAIARSPINLHHSKCAVLGYGKCGRTITASLKGMSAHISVYSREKEECAAAALIADKSRDLSSFCEHAGEFDFIFNTIPALIVDAKVLKRVKHSVTIIDIASAPGGIDYDEAKHRGISAAPCLGLPGKYAPSSSAKFIRETIDTLMSDISK